MKRQPKGTRKGGQFASDTSGKTRIPRASDVTSFPAVVYPYRKGSNPLRQKAVQLRAYLAAGITEEEAEVRIATFRTFTSTYTAILNALPVEDETQRSKIASLLELSRTGGTHKFPVLVTAEGNLVPAIIVPTDEGSYWATWTNVSEALNPDVPATDVFSASPQELRDRGYRQGFQVRVATVTIDPRTGTAMFIPDDNRSKPRPLPNPNAPTWIRKPRPN